MRNLQKTVILAFASMSILATAQTTSEPDDLIKLRESWQRAIQQANAPLNKKYEEALTAMKTRFTKDGKLQEALAVDNELKSLASRASEPKITDTVNKASRLRQLKTEDEFAQWLANSKWESESGAGLSFSQDGRSFAFVDAKTKEEVGSYPLTFVNVGLIEFKWASGPNGQIQFADDLKSCGHGGRIYELLKD